ncbi:MAG: hypothetical protein IKC42_05510 [Alistipes sp.]|nr:hypothetical protein [Alistipes sp.]
MKKIVSTLLFIIAAVSIDSLQAQPYNAEFFAKNPDCAGGIYYTYRFTNPPQTAVPKGYKPFYVSHFGRHGSRWHDSKGVYSMPVDMFRAASEANALTERGKVLYRELSDIAKRAKGREGELTPQGVSEHRGIAERMFYNFPHLFRGGDKHVLCFSSAAPRCILSMAAFNERLKEINPKLDITRIVNDSVQVFTRAQRGIKSIHSQGIKLTNPLINNAIVEIMEDALPHLINAEFIAEYRRKDDNLYRKTVRSLYYLSLVMQTSEGDYRYGDIFTPEQVAKVWEQINKQRYMLYGASLSSGDVVLGDGANLVKEIVRDADAYIADVDANRANRSATLRFGHDYTVIASLAAMQVEGLSARTDDLDNLKDVWADFHISPMAANLQFIFYRNGAGKILVKLLHNEAECRFPIESQTAPYYEWSKLRDYLLQRIDEIGDLEKVKRLPKNRFHYVGM